LNSAATLSPPIVQVQETTAWCRNTKGNSSDYGREQGIGFEVARRRLQLQLVEISGGKSPATRLSTRRAQTGLDIAQALTVGELSKGHRQILVPARQTSVVSITAVTSHALLKFDVREVSDQLCKDSSASVHPPLLRRSGAPAISGGSSQVQFKSFSAKCKLSN
jgi:hypothetical protein